MKITLKTDVVVKPFGSFTSNLYSKWGDLDTSVELSHCSPSSTAKKCKLTALRGIMKALRRNGNFCSFLLVSFLSFNCCKKVLQNLNISAECPFSDEILK